MTHYTLFGKWCTPNFNTANMIQFQTFITVLHLSGLANKTSNVLLFFLPYLFVKPEAIKNAVLRERTFHLTKLPLSEI